MPTETSKPAERTPPQVTSRAAAPRVVVVCLPAKTEPELLPEAAAGVLRAHGLTPGAVIQHFPARPTSWRRFVGRRRCGLTWGGPVKLLDLAGMRRAATAAAAAQWVTWREVVAGTGPARPYWQFLDRHHADPRRYPLSQAVTDYLAQPRILAMNTHNAMPHRWRLPTGAVEAFQTGYRAYVTVAWLAAVPGDALAVAHGPRQEWLTSASERLADQLAYLRVANARLARLHPTVRLVAITAA